MTKVIIVGASGSLVPSLVEASDKLQNVSLTLFLRKKTRLAKSISAGYDIIEGDAMSVPGLSSAIRGKDIVYVNLAGDLETMANKIVTAMKEAGVKRVIAISSIGIYKTPLKPVLLPYRKLTDVIENSGLEYTILRPDWFTDANEIDFAVTHKGEPEGGAPVSRKSIAAFVTRLIENPDLFKNENIGISKPILRK